MLGEADTNGLKVGKKLSPQHALNSARLMNAAPPEFLSICVSPECSAKTSLLIEILDQQELFLELQYLISELNLDNTVFRSDHASIICSKRALKVTNHVCSQKFNKPYSTQ